MTVSRLSQARKAVHPRHWANRKSAVHHRFYAKVEIDWDTGCWNWTGALSSAGYGLFGRQTAHRWAYGFFVRQPQTDEHIDHLCRNRRCVNWHHLEAVSPRENGRRGIKGVLTTHCPQGHPYDEANTLYRRNGHRVCRQCNRERVQRHYRNKGVTR
jgi:hypothetical protein